MMSSSRKFLLLAAAVITALPLIAQTPSEGTFDKGFTEIESIQGTLNSSDKVVKLDSTVGYDFNKHFGVYGGLPFYFASLSSTTTGTTGNTTTNKRKAAVGNVCLGLAVRGRN